MPERAGGGFMEFQHPSCPLYLPRMPYRAGGGHSWCFHVIHISSISLACKGKPEVNVHGLSMLFPPSTPPLPARLSRIWTFLAFWRCQRLKTELEVVSWCAMAWIRRLGHDP